MKLGRGGKLGLRKEVMRKEDGRINWGGERKGELKKESRMSKEDGRKMRRGREGGTE